MSLEALEARVAALESNLSGTLDILQEYKKTIDLLVRQVATVLPKADVLLEIAATPRQRDD